jgi:hypothetical protein
MNQRNTNKSPPPQIEVRKAHDQKFKPLTMRLENMFSQLKESDAFLQNMINPAHLEGQSG